MTKDRRPLLRDKPTRDALHSYLGGVSSFWLKERGRDYADFEWQSGYADMPMSQ